MVPPVKMMWTRGVFRLMVNDYLLGVTIFFFGSTPLAALLPAVVGLATLLTGLLLDLVAVALVPVVGLLAVA